MISSTRSSSRLRYQTSARHVPRPDEHHRKKLLPTAMSVSRSHMPLLGCKNMPCGVLFFVLSQIINRASSSIVRLRSSNRSKRDALYPVLLSVRLQCSKLQRKVDETEAGLKRPRVQDHALFSPPLRALCSPRLRSLELPRLSFLELPRLLFVNHRMSTRSNETG